MKKSLIALLALVLMAYAIMIPIAAAAETATLEPPLALTPEPSAVPEASPSEATLAAAITALPEPNPSEPFTWDYLKTIAGAAAATLLIVQFLKAPIDRIWKIPTRALAYIISLIIMLVATAFSGGLTPESALLAVINAFVSAIIAIGAYEVEFSKVKSAQKGE